jgi:hypothetical protein
MSSIDTTFLRQLMSKNEQVINEGRAAELREQDGYTNAVLIADAKELLGIGDEDLIVGSYEGVLKVHNLEVNSLISIVNTLTSGKGAFSAETIAALEKGRDELLEKVATNYKVDKADLFEEGE